MWLTEYVVFIWTFYALTQDSDALLCSKGQMAVRSQNKCVPCPPGFYQPEKTTSQYCKPCSKCLREMGSETEEHCTSVRNTKCKCQENFVSLDEGSITCKCADGFTERFGACVKVEEQSQTKAPTTVQIHHFQTNVTTPRPQEGATTQKPAPNMATTPSGELSIRTVSGSFVGLICLVVTLLALTALICKLNLLQRMKRRPEHSDSYRDGSFRTPVEESGDGSQDSLKQNLDEP